MRANVNRNYYYFLKNVKYMLNIKFIEFAFEIIF